MKKLRTYLSKFLHRLLLWTKPAYRRHRTNEQKKFDLKIQYMFAGCLIGMLIVACLILTKHFMTEKKQIIVETVPTPVMTEITEPVITEPPLVFDNISPNIETTEKQITSVEIKLKKKETLSGLLKRAKVPLSKSLEAASALEIVCDTKKLQAGQTFEIFFIEDDFQGFKFENKKGETISVLKNANNEFIPQSKEGIIENKRFVLFGIVEGSFSKSAEKIGVPSRVTQQVISALSDKIDFSKDLKPNAPFKIIYEQKMTQSGKPIGNSQLLYISLMTHTKMCQRYFFIDSMGVRGYYDENGQSTPQTIMKRPLGAGRVSSPFGMRLHPILGYQIQHKGVDFAAPLGTPVPAAADGVIQKIGRNGGYGKFIQIKHNDTYITAYGHLNGYAADLRVGSTVKKGEIIGYVGNTGRSTGPHLHYEILKNKQPVNPLKSTYTIPKRVLKNQSLEQFKRQRAWIDSLKATPIPDKVEKMEELAEDDAEDEPIDQQVEIQVELETQVKTQPAIETELEVKLEIGNLPQTEIKPPPPTPPDVETKSTDPPLT